MKHDQSYLKIKLIKDASVPEKSFHCLVETKEYDYLLPKNPAEINRDAFKSIINALGTRVSTDIGYVNLMRFDIVQFESWCTVNNENYITE
jgi:hypothetical protein